MHRGVAGGKADEPGHADVIGIVVFDMLLAAERMHDRALQRLGELHERRMGAGAAPAAEQRHPLGVVQQLGQRVEFASAPAARSAPAAADRRRGEMPRAGAGRSATSPGMTTTATPRRPTAARIAFSST